MDDRQSTKMTHNRGKGEGMEGGSLGERGFGSWELEERGGRWRLEMKRRFD
jgi:hypothetical protein